MLTIIERKTGESARDYVTRVLIDNIVNVHLEPGEKLLENDLSGQLGVRRTPYREAVLALAERQLVHIRPKKGTYVSHIDLKLVEEVRHLRSIVETELAVMACDLLTEEDLDIVMEQYEILAKDMLRREKEGKPITFYHYMLDLTGGPCIYKRISGCGSGTEYMAVTPWGDLYPCHQFVGEEAYKLGDIWNGVTNTALREEFRSCNAYARPECNDCWARFYCSGGCAANAYLATGSITGVYEYGCELF